MGSLDTLFSQQLGFATNSNTLSRVIACMVFAILLSYSTIKCVDIFRNSLPVLDQIYAQPTIDQADHVRYGPQSYQFNFKQPAIPRLTENVIAVGELLPISVQSSRTVSDSDSDQGYRQYREATMAPHSLQSHTAEPSLNHRYATTATMRLSSEQQTPLHFRCSAPNRCDHSSEDFELMLEEIRREKILEQDKYALLYQKIKRLQKLMAGGNLKATTASKSLNSYRHSAKTSPLQVSDHSLVHPPDIHNPASSKIVKSRLRIKRKSSVLHSRDSSPHPAVDIDFNPERLFSGYDLAGGDTPGRHLDEKRQQHVLRSLRKHHYTGIVTRKGEIVLKKKRASQERLNLLHQRLSTKPTIASDTVEGLAPQKVSEGQGKQSGSEGNVQQRATIANVPEAERVYKHNDETEAERGFLAALKASQANPYKAAMTGTVFEHFIKLRQAAAAKKAQ